VSVQSANAGGLYSASNGAASAVITGPDASSIPLSISIGATVQLPNSDAQYSITAVVAMGQETQLARPMSQFNGDTCGYDGSNAVYECVTMYYNIKSDAYDFFADNVQDSIAATNEDPHDVVLSSLSMTTGGNGIACSGSGTLSGGETWNISSPSSGTAYYRTASWSGNYYRINSELSDFQNVQGTLYWYYRGNAEQLKFTYTLPDSQGGWPHGGCTN
jgi:hypothetical protein